MLKKGDIIRLYDTGKKGVIIDWGVYHQKFKRYVISKKDIAECIRVWTDGNIEVWPIKKINPM